jgi:putative transposase
MGLRFPEQKNYGCFFVTTTFKEWKSLGKIEGFYEILADSLIFYSNKYEVKISGYVFMPSHIHLLIFIDGHRLSAFMRDLKKFISQKSAKEIGIIEENIWTPRYDRVAIINEDIFRGKLNYIHNNPIKGQLVSSPEDWLWSSAGDYLSERPGLIPIWKDWT